MSSDDLEKMAIGSIAPGQKIPGGEFTGRQTYDYSHVVPEAHRKDYKIHVVYEPKDEEWQAHLLHTTPGYKPMRVGTVDSSVTGKGVHIDFARIGQNDNDGAHRGKGLGTAMYEALIAHAKHFLGSTHVYGEQHSSLASQVHQRLAAKHGMDYRAVPNVERFKTESKWKAAPTGPFDNKYAPYSYAIKSELRKTQQDKVACIVVYDEKGKILFGRRNDNGKWTQPGGHFEVGESPEEAARRELKEEAGFDAEDLTFMGDGLAGRSNDKRIYVFSTTVHGVPDSSGDPDREVSEWKWIDVSDGLPKDVADHLHAPKNVALRLLKLQDGPLTKNLKDRFLALAAAGAMIASPAAALSPEHDPGTAYNQPHTAEWKPTGLARELYPIAHLESSFGKRLNHLPHSRGEFWSSFGAVGLKPVTAHEAYVRNVPLQRLFPNLVDQDRFLRTFKQDPLFYNSVASAVWARLKKIAGGDLSRTAYAWRWGAGKMSQSAPEQIAADPYVQAFLRLLAKYNPPVTKHRFESAITEWLAKAVGTGKMQLTPNGMSLLEGGHRGSATADTGMTLQDVFDGHSPDVINTKNGQFRIYDLAGDPFNMFHPVPRETTHGMVFEPVTLKDIEAKLKQLGYHGYRGRSLDPSTFVLWGEPKPGD